MQLTKQLLCFVFALLVFLISCSNGNRSASIRNAEGQVSLPKSAKDPNGDKHVLSGKASYYADRFEGRRTASGATYRAAKLTAAHRTLPFGTVARVHDPENNRSVVVTINDRGPYSDNKVIDLSRSAAEDLQMIRRGVIAVRIEILQWGGVE